MKEYLFMPYTPTGCAISTEIAYTSIFASSPNNGIDQCIAKQSLDNNTTDKDTLISLVKKNCVNSNKNKKQDILYCVPEKTLEILWSNGYCQDKNGFPMVASDGHLVC